LCPLFLFFELKTRSRIREFGEQSKILSVGCLDGGKLFRLRGNCRFLRRPTERGRRIFAIVYFDLAEKERSTVLNAAIKVAM
jgi:hypothetical protein